MPFRWLELFHNVENRYHSFSYEIESCIKDEANTKRGDAKAIQYCTKYAHPPLCKVWRALITIPENPCELNEENIGVLEPVLDKTISQ